MNDWEAPGVVPITILISSINDQIQNKTYHTVRIIQNSIDWFGYNYPCRPIILSSWPPRHPTYIVRRKYQIMKYDKWCLVIISSEPVCTGWHFGENHRSKFQTKSLSYFHGNKLSMYKECFDKKLNLFNGI